MRKAYVVVRGMGFVPLLVHLRLASWRAAQCDRSNITGKLVFEINLQMS